MDGQNQVQDERFREAHSLLTELILPIPKAWMQTLAVAIVLSLFEVTRNADGGVTVSLHVTAITTILVGLVWLPFLLKVVALSGGGIKTPAGEASTPGLASWLHTAKDAVVSGIAAVDTAQAVAPAAQRPVLQQIQSELQDKLVGLSTLSTPTSPRDQGSAYLTTLRTLARTYERLRATLPSSSQRTFEMSKITAEARAIAQATLITSADAISLFQEGREGSRVVALAVMQAKPDPAYFPLVLDAIDHSRSAFEQYQALRTAQVLLPMLSAEQKQQLAQVISHQQSGQPGTHITPDSDRRPLSDNILKAI
jgi:hypothetical protein